MRVLRHRIIPVLLLVALILVPTQLVATSLVHMDLAQLAQRADRIFRGTVVDVMPGTVAAGGGVLPMVTYRLQVEESFKGVADLVKGDVSIVEVRMVGDIKPAGGGEVQHLSIFRDVPKLAMGRDYLLFTTAPSSVGLSTTVGLGQGAFKVFERDKESFAVNGFNNFGLGLEATGPVAYSELAAKIRSLLGQ